MIISNNGKIIYTQYNVVSSDYVYTSDGSNGADDGWFTVKDDEIAIAYGIATLTATTLSIRVEGRFDTYNRAIELYERNATGVTNIDRMVLVNEPVKEIRLGIKADSTSSPNTIYAGLVKMGVK